MDGLAKTIALVRDAVWALVGILLMVLVVLVLTGSIQLVGSGNSKANQPSGQGGGEQQPQQEPPGQGSGPRFTPQQRDCVARILGQQRADELANNQGAPPTQEEQQKAGVCFGQSGPGNQGGPAEPAPPK